jgi:Tol biopolymer transport system component/DNA-binding winged helix-turn-helix (wHTH) protein
MNNQQPSFPTSPCEVSPFRIGEWLVEPGLNRISRGEEAAQIEPRVMHVLCCLALAPGRVVSRNTLLEAVWTRVVVNEEVLTHAISQLRRVLGDDPKRPKFIQTIHKTGYRLVQPVEWVAAGEPAAADLGASPGASPIVVPGSAAGPPLASAGVQPAPGGAEARPRPGSRPLLSMPRSRLALVFIGLALIMLTVSVVATLPRSRLSALHNPVVLDEVPFTSYPGRETHPAISPDGTRVAFSWREDEGSDYHIYIKQRNTEVPLRLTGTEGGEYCPVWSPDGTEIAYGLISGGEVSINVIPSIGGSPRRVVAGLRAIGGIDWSPDGSLLAYGSIEDPGGPYRVFLCRLATGEITVLTDPVRSSRGDLRPVFSPDGRRLAFVRGDATNLHDIYLIPIGGGEPERLTHSLHNIGGLDWAADGKSLIFSSAPTTVADSRLWRVSVGDGSLTWLPIGARRPGRLSAALKGRGLVLEEGSVSSDILRVRVDAPAEGPVPIASSTRHDYNPQYSPGGRFIAFLSTRSGTPQVWVCDADGTDPRQVTELEHACIWTPCWSYDESRVAFSAAPENVAGIYVAEIETGRVRCLSESDRHQIVLGWSRDGRSLYCKVDVDGRWWVRRMAIDGSGTSDLVEKDVFRLAESIDGRRLIYSRSDTSCVWSVSVDGTDETCLADEPERVAPCGWREVEGGLFFFSLVIEGGEMRTVNLCFKDRATGETSTVATSVNFVGHNIDVSPGGDFVIADRLEDLGSDLVLVESFR